MEAGIDDGFRNSGQVCGGLSRMLVQRSRFAEAQELAVQKAESFVIGDPLDPATTLGPVISGRQRDRIREYISFGQSAGVPMLTGGPEAPEGFDVGYYVKPTIFAARDEARADRPDSDQRHADQHEGAPRRFQALGDRTRDGPVRDRGIPRIQVRDWLSDRSKETASDVHR